MELREILPRLGHRNWIAVVDAAFPEMVAPGATTVIGGDIESVLALLSEQRHVRAEPFLDSELAQMTDEDAPGISDFRTRLEARLQGIPVQRLPHDEIIAMIDAAAQTFRVVVVKTPVLLPYTSLFLRLECGYWNAAAEARLRERIS